MRLETYVLVEPIKQGNVGNRETLSFKQIDLLKESLTYSLATASHLTDLERKRIAKLLAKLLRVSE